jgi:hypothetical protein
MTFHENHPHIMKTWAGYDPALTPDSEYWKIIFDGLVDKIQSLTPDTPEGARQYYEIMAKWDASMTYMQIVDILEPEYQKLLHHDASITAQAAV